MVPGPTVTPNRGQWMLATDAGTTTAVLRMVARLTLVGSTAVLGMVCPAGIQRMVPRPGGGGAAAAKRCAGELGNS